jgi:hypothetical protein
MIDLKKDAQPAKCVNAFEDRSVEVIVEVETTFVRLYTFPTARRVVYRFFS